jgi:NADH dehydrogenase [ubiquinone] 1 alpha subcomplex assembly factor 5
MSDSEIFDRAAGRRRLEIAMQKGAASHAYHVAIADELIDRLSLITRRFSRALVIGEGGAAIAERLRADGLAATTASRSGWAADVQCDEDRLPFADNSFDLVIAAGGLDIVDDLPGALTLIRRSLQPDGLFLAAFPAAGSLSRLRRAAIDADMACGAATSAHIHPQIEVRSGGDLLTRAGFALPVADSVDTTIRYAGLVDLIKDLRSLGMTNIMNGRRAVSRQWLIAAAEAFAHNADPDRRVPETLSILVLTGWSPSPDQPKPAKRGSGATSLANALRK